MSERPRIRHDDDPPDRDERKRRQAAEQAERVPNDPATTELRRLRDTDPQTFYSLSPGLRMQVGYADAAEQAAEGDDR